MKTILHHGILLHPKAQGKQHRWRCMGNGAILSRETMAPFPASPHGVGINPKKYHFLNFLIVSAMIFCFKIMLTST